MAFWDAWFKTPCLECGEKFDKEALEIFEERLICGDCKDEILEKRRIAEEERIKRVAAEEEARRKLLDRPINTSGTPFGATGREDDGNSRF